MKRDREFEGKDLVEVLNKAAAALGIPEPEVDYEILQQGRRGLFGIGARKMRIRVLPPLDLGDRARPPAEVPRGRGRGRDRARRRPDAAAAPAARAPRPVAPTSPGDTESVRQTLQQMLDLSGLELETKAEVAESGVRIDVSGPDAAMLEEKDGELLAALQFLLNRMSRRAWPEVQRVRLSSKGGKSGGRDAELIELTREVAQQVQRTGRAKRLHPMNAYERRIVHMTAREIRGVGSRSEGEGSVKVVQIFKSGRSSSQREGSRRGGGRRGGGRRGGRRPAKES